MIVENKAMPLRMEEIQKIALEILKRITQVCEANGYRYSLAFGTLIGAVRHHGFIPWDDDIDILMPRPDYEQLLKYMQMNPIKHLEVLNFRTSKNVFYGLTRISDSRFRIVEEKFGDYGSGIFIDVYPVDGLDNTIKASQALYPYAFELEDIALDIVRKDVKVWRPQLPLKARIHRCLRFLNYHIHGNRYYLKELEKYAMSHPFDEYKYVGNINWSWKPLCFEREWFDDLVKLPFEDTFFYAVKNYDEMLRQQYGDYMQLPPEHDRIYHHCYSAYVK